MAVIKEGKRYWVQIRYKDISGNQKTHNKKWFSTKMSAREYEISYKKYLSESHDDSITASELYKLLVIDKKSKVKQTTIDVLNNAYKLYIKPYFAEKKIKQINNHYISNWFQEINNKRILQTGKPFSNNYLDTIADKLKMILNYGKKLGYYNNTFIVEPPKNPNEIKKQLSYWDIKTFKEFISVVDNEDWHDIFTILYYTGMRKGELMGLQWKDFNGKQLPIYKALNKRNILTSPKTKNSNRVYELPNKLINLLNKRKSRFESYPEFNNEWYIFGNYTPLSRTSLKRFFDYYISISNVSYLNIHGLRHSCVSMLKQKGMSYQSISAYIGDSELMVIKTYSHIFGSEKQKVSNLLEKII